MRDMTNMSQEDAKKNGWLVIKPLECEVVGKATYENGEISIMKSTKRFKVPGGWIYNTSTEVHKWSNISVAEAMVFVAEEKK